MQPFFGDQWVRLERLTDAAHCLRLADRHKAEMTLDDLERAFPQVFVAFYFGSLPPVLNPQEVAFWLINNGAFSTPQISKRNEYGVVCVVDPAAGTVGTAIGYALESLLAETAPTMILQAMVPALSHAEYGGAIEAAATSVSDLLRPLAIARPITQSLSPGPHAGSSAADYGLHPLRSGHRQTDSTPSPSRQRR
ncbi:MAG: hypothetical protein KDK97_22190 [Verrucomicrobiales bacterium]|nr:hypothetical protein [Verrucomicrobiales bacterium]MCP5558188.1 hypothetical protein [Verrucomicrobiaceae bacterium]